MSRDLRKGVLRPRHEHLPARAQEGGPRLAPSRRIQLRPKVVEEQDRPSPEIRPDEAPRHQNQGDDQPPLLPAAEGGGGGPPETRYDQIVPVRPGERTAGTRLPLRRRLQRREQKVGAAPRNLGLGPEDKGKGEGKGGKVRLGPQALQHPIEHPPSALQNPSSQTRKGRGRPRGRTALPQKGDAMADKLAILREPARIGGDAEGAEPIEKTAPEKDRIVWAGLGMERIVKVGDKVSINYYKKK